jgi:hypothetical protein
LEQIHDTRHGLFSPPYRIDRSGLHARAVLMAITLSLCVWPALAQEKAVLKLTTPTTAVRLFGAHCTIACWISGLFAPAVVRDRVAAVPVTNGSKDKIKVSAQLIPTNGLALAANAPYLKLSSLSGQDMVTSGNAPEIEVAAGETAQLKLEAASADLTSGLYTGQLQFRAVPTAGSADAITQSAAVELRIRDSVVWALLTVVLGIVLGRVAQLVYDPKLMARMQLLDWLNELEARINRLSEPPQSTLRTKLEALRAELFSRGVDPTSLQPKFQSLEIEVNAADPGHPAVAAAAAETGRAATSNGSKFANGIGAVLRMLGGVTPLSLRGAYNWLLPLFVILTLLALTVVFTLQQYGGSGTAETFGASGLADYVALFLAGIAAEAIAGGLRAVKFVRPAG